MELKKTVKYDGKLKGLQFFDGALVDSEGEVIDLLEVLEKAYGENKFDLSTVSKKEEIIDV